MNNKLSIGIDLISFCVPKYYLDLSLLARKNGLEENHYFDSIRQKKMSITASNEDIVTMASEATYSILSKQDSNYINSIKWLLFATESGIDLSKSTGIYVHKLLGLNNDCRVIELKQACYGATAGIHLAKAIVSENPNDKVLLIASDIAKYQRNTEAESAGGAGSVAMVISLNPKLLVIERGRGVFVEDVMDFWKPNKEEYPIVDGKFSCEMYLKALRESWNRYKKDSSHDFHSHEYFCYHTPVTRLVEVANNKLAKIENISNKKSAENKIESSVIYNKEIGNSYTASLYVSLCSLLDNENKDLSNKRIGLYSYGSGCIGEFYSMSCKNDYRNYLFLKQHKDMISSRVAISFEQYENINLIKNENAMFCFCGVKDSKRVYENIRNRNIVR